MLREIELMYLGHKLTANGIETDEKRIGIIMEITPENKKVQRLLGLINHVGKFIPNLSKFTTPLIQHDPLCLSLPLKIYILVLLLVQEYFREIKCQEISNL